MSFERFMEGLGSVLAAFFSGCWYLLVGWYTKPKVRTLSGSDQQRELAQLYFRTKRDFEDSYIATVKNYDFAILIISDAFDQASEEVEVNYYDLPRSVIQNLVDITVYAIKQENFFDFPEYDFSREIPLSRQIQIRHELEKIKLRIYDDDEVLICFHSSFSHAIRQFLFTITSLVGVEEQKNAFTVAATYFLSDTAYHIERMIISFFGEHIVEYGIFTKVGTQILNNADVASGFPANRTAQEREEKFATLPTDSKLVGKDLIDAYLADTYLENFFDFQVDFSLPLNLRLEHCHILAGTGFGKTQLLQKLVLADLEEGRGCLVIDSQGDMIKKISMLKIFDPQLENSLADKLIIIDPEDVDYPVSLNMFALDRGESQSSSLHKQMLINSTVDLYVYIFASLFGAELTSKQGVIFSYIAKLMAEIPDATIHTLRELLENGKKFQKYIDNLDGSAKAFFDTQFFTSSFAQTKKQILSRLWAILSNQTLENLFSAKKNSVDLFESISNDKIVLVNTSKQLLQTEGSQILGRFFIALLSQAVIKRATVPEENRKPYMVYVDEAQEYFDAKLEQMLNQARKYRVGFTLAHQNLGQLGHLKHTVFSSTSIKLAGGISAKDAVELSYEMKSSKDFLMSMSKSKRGSQIACYLKNVTDTAIPISFSFGELEREDVMSAASFKILIENMRGKYCSHVLELSYGSVSEEENPKTEVAAPAKQTAEVNPEVIKVESGGKGGITHRYLQNLIKKIGQERGFYSVVENPVFDGLGSVDVSLEGFDAKIAIEVSVSTQGKWEGSNISKCFSANYDFVILVSSEKSHLESIKKSISSEFEEQIESKKLLFFVPDQLIAFLDKLKAKSAETEQNVSGYKVKVSYNTLDSREVKLREEAIARVVLGR